MAEGGKRAPAVTTAIPLQCLMAPYVNLDATVHCPPPLSVAMFHHCCIMGWGGNISASSYASMSECTRALRSAKYQRLSIAAIFMDAYGVLDMTVNISGNQSHRPALQKELAS